MIQFKYIKSIMEYPNKYIFTGLNPQLIQAIYFNQRRRIYNDRR